MHSWKPTLTGSYLSWAFQFIWPGVVPLCGFTCSHNLSLFHGFWRKFIPTKSKIDLGQVVSIIRVTDTRWDLQRSWETFLLKNLSKLESHWIYSKSEFSKTEINYSGEKGRKFLTDNLGHQRNPCFVTPERVPVWWREGKKKVKGPFSSERRKDEFSKIEVRGVGDFLLTFSFSSQPDFSLTFFFFLPEPP